MFVPSCTSEARGFVETICNSNAITAPPVCHLGPCWPIMVLLYWTFPSNDVIVQQKRILNTDNGLILMSGNTNTHTNTHPQQPVQNHQLTPTGY